MAYKVFIGSSKESLIYAEEIQRNLEFSNIPEIETECWSAAFHLGAYTLEALLKELKTSSFGIFVLTPDDYIVIRDCVYRIPRDNVILEMGMFIAGLGRENTFFVYPKNTNDYSLKLPTDLDGVVGAAFAAHQHGDNIAAKVSGACVQIKSAIRERVRVMTTQEKVGKIIDEKILDNQKNFSDRLKEYQKQVF